MNNDNDLNLHNRTKLSGWLHYGLKDNYDLLRFTLQVASLSALIRSGKFNDTTTARWYAVFSGLS